MHWQGTHIYVHAYTHRHTVCVRACVRAHAYQMHQNSKLLAVSLPEQKDCRFTFENVMYCSESQNCTLQRYSNCPGQSHLQTVIRELFQANDFDVEDSIVYK
jgi:hypothetical protein